jgi:catechol 2,3-dioxygenase-like lactoylglutathione lyase family enzyme
VTEAAYKVTGHAAVLYVKDMPPALAFYRDKLGFSVQFAWRDPPEYVCLYLGDAAIHLNTYAPPAKSIVCIFCKGVDALYDHFTSRGVTLSKPLQNEPYGMREFAIDDPDGHLLVFGEGIEN